MTWHRTMTLGAAAMIAAASGVAVPAQAQSGWVANDDDFLLLQLTVKSYRMTQDVRGYQTDQGVCLDLADVIQSLDLPVRLDKKSRRATGWLFAEDQQFTIDRSSNTVQNVNNGSAPLTNEIYDTPEGWCVDTGALSRWFGVTFRPDLYNASVKIESGTPLPFMEAIERRSRAARLRKKRPIFDLSQFPSAETEYRLWRTPSVDANIRLGYRNSSSGGTDLDARYELSAAGEVAGTSFTARLSSDRTLKPNSLRVRAYRYDHTGGMLGPLKATQIVAGDAEIQAGQLTSQSAVGRGLFVSNQPLGNPSRFSTTTLRGAMPDGWDAELYRNGQLIAFQTDEGEGRYEFLDVDLYYGRNEFEVVLYGPQGQVRREKVDFPVGRQNIEPGKTYYWAGILQDNRDLIDLRDRSSRLAGGDWRWGVGVERGLSQRTSVAANLSSIVLGGQRERYAEASVSSSLGGMRLDMTGAHRFGGGFALQGNVLGSFGPINFGADAVWRTGAFRSEFVPQQLDWKAGFRFDTSLKLGKFSLPIQGGVAQSRLTDGSKVTSFSTATSFALRNVNLTAQLQREMRDNAATGRQDAETQLRLLSNIRMFGLRMRGSAAFDLSGPDKGLDYVRMATEVPLNDRSDLAFETEYMARSKDLRLSAGYSRRFDKFALRVNGNATTDGNFGANLALSFSFGPDPVTGGLRFSEKKLARSGSAAVTVFRDDDGDGRRDPGEQLMKDVHVEAGFRTTDAVTGENGLALVDGLKPFVPVLVGLDESSLGDPYLAPAVKGIVIVPRPGVHTAIEIPVTSSGEIEGVILAPTGVELGGVELELLDAKGAVIGTTISEFDGFFLFEKVPYGRYRLRVSAAVARKLHVRETLSAAVEVSREKDIARLGVVKLQAGGSTVASAPLPGEASGSAP